MTPSSPGPRGPEPRRTVIDGQTVLVVERRPPLPGTLDRLLAELHITFRAPIRVAGWRAECGREEHRLIDWITGRHVGHDAVRRTLLLRMCLDCESVCVRDTSVDDLSAYDPAGLGASRQSRLAPRHRDRILGWYSGARRNQRQYR